MSRTVKRFAVKRVRERFGPATTNADGFPVSAVASQDVILIHAHPAKGDSLARLPEGLEKTGVFQGYTPAALSLGDRTTGQRPDVVHLLGERFQVVESSPWSGGGQGAQSWRQCLLVALPAVSR